MILNLRFVLAVLAATFAAALATGCADLVRKRADEQIVAGKYEEAIQTYQTGLASHPNEPVLLSGQTNARTDIANKLLAQAAGLRSTGRDQEAEAALNRLLKIEPRNERAAALLLDIARDRRQQTEIARAKKLIEGKQHEAAQNVIESALKDNPRQPELLSLQRRIELEMRADGAASGAIKLDDTRPITLEFRDANVKMLLDAISRSTGVDFILDKDVRPDLRATIFLRGSRLEDALELITSSNQLSRKNLDTRTVLIYPNTPDKQRDYQDLLVRAFFLANSEAKQTAALLKSVLKLKDPFVDEKLNMIVLRESPEVIRLAERLVALHDVGEPEVMLEIEVLEVKASRLYDLGIQFPDTFSLTPLPPLGQNALTLANVEGLGRNRIGLGVGGLTVNLRRDVGDLKTLANPRVRVKNREKAKILVGDKVPVITTSISGAQGSVSENVAYLDVGLKVDVEPQVSLDDEVLIKIALEVSSLAREIKTASGGLAYQIGTRSASTVLRLRDGETQLLAGLISKEDRSNASRLPGLGDLPVLGRLFSTQKDDSQKTEIVLSVTPRVLRNVRLPDVNMTEFWSGSEANVRLRPLTLAPRAASADTKLDTKVDAPAAQTPASPVLAANAGALPSLPLVPPGPSLAAVAAAPGPATVDTLLLGPSEASVGQVFEVEVKAKSATAIRGLPIQLQFDSAALELVEAVEGEFFRQGGANVSFSRAQPDPKGPLSIGLIRNTADGASGEGTAMRLRFKSKKSGDTTVTVISATPVGLGQPVVSRLGAPLKVTIK